MPNRLQQLRQKMATANVDFYYVPVADVHRNEYVPPCWQRCAWISGFTGSAGGVLVGMEQAYLWTDGRYFLQAEKQLDSRAFQLIKQQQGKPPMEEWLKIHAIKKTCAVDSRLMTIQQANQWQAALESTGGKLMAIEENWIDALWKDQPTIPQTPVEILDLHYTGLDTGKKLTAYRKVLVKNGADAEVLTRLDAIAWLFNIRGKDIAYNPLCISYAIVTQQDATFFIDLQKISPTDRTYFDQYNIQLQPYESFQAALNSLKTTVWLDPQGTNWWTQQQLKHADILTGPSPITLMKACKNDTEQQGMREAHRIDAIAMIKFLYWLDHHWQESLTEISAAEQLEIFRRQDPRCQDLSFATISGFASNGAIVHYAADQTSNKAIDNTALYLLDSGGQYREGTTDITRTLHLGQPTKEEKHHYTVVLKGHLALRHAVFPEGTTGEQLDPIARGPIQAAGYDYDHGTGHGVGCYLCVHEGPQIISPRKNGVALQAGMVVSNEPGLYCEGQYGIRIENVCLITRTESLKANASSPYYYTFEDLTLVPYARKLINISELSKEEIQWIDTYHHHVYDALREDLSEKVGNWLKEATKPLNIT